MMPFPDHRDSVGSVHDLLLLHGVPGIQGVDTRGPNQESQGIRYLLCVFGPVDKAREMERILSKMTPPDHEDLVKSVTVDKPVIANPGAMGENGQKLPRLAVLDCGIKYNIIRELCSRFGGLVPCFNAVSKNNGRLEAGRSFRI